jgi:hypothetical protein
VRRPIGIALAGLLLLLPSSASAKEISKITVCGAQDCVSLTAKHGDDRLMVFAQGGPATTRPRAAGWYRLTMFVSEGADQPTSSWSNDWVPSAGRLRADEPGGRHAWLTVPADTQSALKGLADGLEPYPARLLNRPGAVPPAAQVSEVVNPPAAPAPHAAGRPPWTWLAAGGVALLLALALAGRSARPALARRLRPRGAR